MLFREGGACRMFKISASVILFGCALCFLNSASSGSENIEEIVVYGERIFSPGSEIITAEDLALLPADSLEDVLRLSAGIDVRGRGGFGVQNDLSVSGGSFEQVLVLLDGVRMSDLQTGHHQMNIPVSKNDIERIEIISAPASSVYGAGAFSGAVNIITKKSHKKSVGAELAFYEKNTFSGRISFSPPMKGGNMLLSASRKRSPGYFPGRDFAVNDYFGRVFLPGKNSVSLSAGRQDKDFGAYHFYGTGTSGEREETCLEFANLEFRVPFSRSFFLSNKTFVRRHGDKFEYLWGGNLYGNSHQNIRSGNEAVLHFVSGYNSFSCGAEYSREEITSNVLKNEHTRAVSFFERFRRKKGISEFNLNLRTDRSGRWDKINSISMGEEITLNRLRVHILYASAFRPPSYTELHYWDPANEGDTALHLEKSRYYETGMTAGAFSAAVFLRSGRDIIDWVKFNSTDTFHAWNIPEFDTKGARLKYFFSFRAIGGQAGYTFLKASAPGGIYDSKYALRYPAHKFSLRLKGHLFPRASSRAGALSARHGGLSAAVSGSYLKRRSEAGYFVMDARIEKRFGNYSLFLEAANLFNRKFQSQPPVPAHGRWAGVGITAGL
ncbi:MAG: TonB-dependent receptor [Candidatus Omnitrophica bacterium]|nr:TonB-dependent receptor [Candidatus Omnitrophota bacterium]